MGKTLDEALATLPSEALHRNGLLVIAPQGAGKTRYCDTHPQWCDSDKVFLAAGLMKRQQEASPETLKQWEKQNQELKRRGYWVLSSAWWSLKDADAVVLPTRSQLVHRLSQKTGQDKIADPEFAADNQLRLLREWAAKSGKLVYASIGEACYMTP